MKIVKTTHCRGQEKTTDFVWFESEDIELIKKKLARLGQFLQKGCPKIVIGYALVSNNY